MQLITTSLVLLLTSLVAANNGTTCPGTSFACSNACAQIASEFGSDLHYPGSDNFTVWDAKQQEVQSACRVTPTSTQAVSRIVEIVTQNWCRFAVKGGGHARNADDSVSVGGVTIDMVKMRTINVSDDRASAILGSGHILYSLYTGLEAYNLSTTGGRVADVGLGGFALGGGISNFSPKYGMAIDNIYEYEVVLANATIVTVNQCENPDLYFALRGGMNNFGIVTHFTMRTFAQGKLFSGNRRFAAESRDLVVDEAFKLTTVWKNDTNMAFSYGYAYQQATDKFTLSVTEAYAEPIFNPAPFQALNAGPYTSSTLRIERMSNFSLEGAAARPPGGRNLYASMSYYPSSSLDKVVQDIVAEEIQPIKSIRGFSPNVIFQPFYEGMIRAGKDRGGNALGIDADEPLTMVLLTTQWSDAQDDVAAYDFAARFIKRVEAAIASAGKGHRWFYINYANQQQDPFAGYGETNLQRLKQAARDYDPMGVFSSRGLCRGYFKLL